MTSTLLSPELTQQHLANPLWDYACSRYQNPEVKRICLLLQDQWHADINILLAAGWSARIRQQPNWQVVLEQIRCWQNDIIKPLRMVRQRLRSEHELERGLRSELLTLELTAEQIELAAIHQSIVYRTPSSPASTPVSSPLHPQPCREWVYNNLCRYFGLLEAQYPTLETISTGLIGQLSEHLAAELFTNI